MLREFDSTPVFCRNCTNSIDFHSPETVNLGCSFQDCLCKNYVDHDDLPLVMEHDRDPCSAYHGLIELTRIDYYV
jgi:hypothetical protein